MLELNFFVCFNFMSGIWLRKKSFHCLNAFINKIASHYLPVSAFKFDELSDFFFLGDFGCRKQLMKGNEKNKTFLVKVTK